MATEKRECSCLSCAINDLLEERYPDEITDEECVQELRALANVSGFLLQGLPQSSLTDFVGSVIKRRAFYAGRAQLAADPALPVDVAGGTVN